MKDEKIIDDNYVCMEPDSAEVTPIPNVNPVGRDETSFNSNALTNIANNNNTPIPGEATNDKIKFSNSKKIDAAVTHENDITASPFKPITKPNKSVKERKKNEKKEGNNNNKSIKSPKVEPTWQRVISNNKIN